MTKWITTIRDRHSAKYLRKHSELRAEIAAVKSHDLTKHDRKWAASILFRNQAES